MYGKYPEKTNILNTIFQKILKNKQLHISRKNFLVCARARTYARVYIKYNNILYYITYSI